MAILSEILCNRFLHCILRTLFVHIRPLVSPVVSPLFQRYHLGQVGHADVDVGGRAGVAPSRGHVGFDEGVRHRDLLNVEGELEG